MYTPVLAKQKSSQGARGWHSCQSNGLTMGDSAWEKGTTDPRTQDVVKECDRVIVSHER